MTADKLCVLCGWPCPPHRSRYCSAACARAVERGRAARHYAPLVTGHAAMRTCLRCGEPFASSWAGHRVCRSCSDRGDDWAPKSVRAQYLGGGEDAEKEQDCG